MRLPAVVFGVLGIAAIAAAQSAAVHIETSSGMSQFRTGEAIVLRLTFELNDAPQAPDETKPGWLIAFVEHDRSVLNFGRDRFGVSPETGTRDPWNYRQNEGLGHNGPRGGFRRDKSLILDIDLNQWVRFERPGHYTVTLHSHVKNPQNQDIELDSNELGIDIISADPEWLAAELAIDIAALDRTQSKTDSESSEARTNAARRIAYLDTPAAVQEMARRLGTPDQMALIFADGLRSNQYGSYAVIAMRELMRSPSQPVPFIFLSTLAGLDKTLTDPQSLLAGVINQKQGAAKAISFKTLLDGLSAERVSPEVRSEIAGLFEDLPDSQQFDLLGHDWEKIKTPEMIPVLRHIYEITPKTRQTGNLLLKSAIERLYELDTSGTRSLLIEEMKQREPRLPCHMLSMLPDNTIPELDAVLLDNFQHDGAGPVEELIARYATNSISDPIKEYYMTRGVEARSSNTVSPACETPLLAYFLRVEPVWGEKSFREALADRPYPAGGCWSGMIGRAGAYYSGPVWEKIAVDSLQDPAAAVKIDAVRSLGQYGSPESKSAAFDAFRAWHEWQENRGEPNEENRRVEEAFVGAITRSKSWSLTNDDLETVRDLCLTAGCRSQVPQRVN